MRIDPSIKQPITKRYVTLLALCITASLTLSGCSSGNKAIVQLVPRPIATEVITKQKISNPIEQVADVIAGTTLDVTPMASGEVTAVLRKRGDYVVKGEVLFTIDNRDVKSAQLKSQLSLKSAQESLQKAMDDKVNNRRDFLDAITSAETALKNAVQDNNKLRNDFDAGLATQRQLDQSKQAVESAQINLESAKSKLNIHDSTNTSTTYETQKESAQLSLDDATRSLENYSVKAPGSGILTDFNVLNGQSISSGGGKVGQVQQIDPIKIATELSDTNYQLVKGKQEVVYYDPDAPATKLTGTISYLAPIMSATTKTYTMELEVPNPDHTIQPGKRFMLQLTTETEEKVVAIKTLSVIREESDAFVYVQQGDQYQKRKVKLGRLNGEYQEVLEGVKEEELLVITGQNTLKDGQKVDTAQSAGTPAANK